MEYINTNDSSRTKCAKENYPKQFIMSSLHSTDHEDIITKK